MLVVSSPFPTLAFRQVYDWWLPYWRSVASDATPRDYDGWLRQQLDIVAHPQVRTWGVWRDGELGGYVWAGIDEHIARPHVVFKRSFWGRATTLPALNRVADDLFSSGVVKVEIWMWADNRRARALALRAGAIEEGVLTAQGRRDGVLTDCAVYGLRRVNGKTDLREQEDKALPRE